MDNLFTEIDNSKRRKNAPLPVRMRPQRLEDLIGQEDALGEGTWLRAAIEGDTLSSVILYGPAGTGKTSIAHIIAETTHAHFVEVSAIGGTVADLRREIAEADKRLVSLGIRTILFVDEIHRFNRSQQDALLHAVEDGVVVLIGATTENPFFEVNSALISRSRVVELHRLSDEALSAIVDRALEAPEGLGGTLSLTEDARKALFLLAGGDARSALNTLSLASDLARAKKEETITEEMVRTAVPHRSLPYDKKQDMHYDVISAFIKSMRGSDPDAVLYWLARMLDGGEDPKFIARRIFIAAAEDVGNADPNAVLVAEAAFRAVEVIGMPECRINLAQAAVYMALAPKSNASYMGLAKAFEEVRNGQLRPVPNHLRDRHRPGSEEYGEYLYPHDAPEGYVHQQYLPDGLEKGVFFTPGERGWERYRTEAPSSDRM
jgi:putative ATPase